MGLAGHSTIEHVHYDAHSVETACGITPVGHGASLRDRAKKAPASIARALKIDFRGHVDRNDVIGACDQGYACAYMNSMICCVRPATRMAATRVPRDHIAKVLNHVEGGARAARL